MSEIDLAPLQNILNPYIPLGRSGLLPALHAAQKHYGWLSQPVAAEVAKALSVSAGGCAWRDRVLQPVLQRTGWEKDDQGLYGPGLCPQRRGRIA